tara:strand:- start:479 stop:1615 length:1137 start_codon:yes stop_codon:yes gene_type:complete
MDHKIIQRDIESLIFAEYNPRQLTQDQYKHLKDSITRFGLVDPIIVNKNKERKNIIVGGHQRVKVAKDLKIKKVPVLEIDLTYEKERELNVRLNKNTGEWDYDNLANFFDMDELTDWGFSDDDLKLFDLEEEIKEGLVDDDDVPEVEESICKAGDLWLLGEHRLLCGDATKKEDVELLMDGQKADLTLTDPPYNLNYKYNSYNDNKDKSEYISFCSTFHQLSKSISDKQILTTGKQNLGLWYKIADIKDYGIWYAKNKMSGGKISNLALCEPIIFIGDFDRNSRANDFFEYNVKQQSDTGNHTCPKIIDLWLDIVESYSDKKIYDPFMGSGTTLIACEKTNRKCYGMELDPHYCDVIIKRWEQFTGKVAKLDGKTEEI